MNITFVHHFKANIGAVDHIGPGRNGTTLGIQDGLVEVKAVEVKGETADS